MARDTILQWNLSSWLRHPLPAHPLPVPAVLEQRIYVYSEEELPARWNSAVDGPVLMRHGVYLKGERIFHDLLRASAAVTVRRSDARFFFVPLYVGQLASSSTDGRRSVRVEETAAALAALAATKDAVWPSRARDHIFANAVDRGRCFQDDGLDRFLDAAVLMYEGTARYPPSPGASSHKLPPPFPCHREESDVVLPPIVDVGAHTARRYPPELTHSADTFPWSFFTHRETLFVWRGSATRTAWAAGAAEANVRMTLLGAFGSKSASGAAVGANANNNSEPTGRSAVATSMGWSARLDAMPSLVSARKVDKDAHYREMRDALFCLAPSGWAQWTVRFFEAVQLGCIPVTFLSSAQRRPRMPFDTDGLDYTRFSVNIAPGEIRTSLRSRLLAIAGNRSALRGMQRALWEARPALDWSNLGRHGPFYRILQQLDKRSRLGRQASV